MSPKLTHSKAWLRSLESPKILADRVALRYLVGTDFYVIVMLFNCGGDKKRRRYTLEGYLN